MGALVKSPFINYNKSNEVCKKHAGKEYHVNADDRAYAFKSNPQSRVDSLLLDVGTKNFKL